MALLQARDWWNSLPAEDRHALEESAIALRQVGRRSMTGTAGGRPMARGRGSCMPCSPPRTPRAGSTGCGELGFHGMPSSPACRRVRRWPARVPGRRRPAEDRSDEAVGRSRGGLTTKIHLASDGSRRPLSVLITPGQWGDAPQLITVLDRIRVPRPAGNRSRSKPDHVCGDKAYGSRRNRQYLRRRQIQHTIPERRDQRVNRRRRGNGGGRPAAFDQFRYARGNKVERCINALKGCRAVATRYGKRAYTFPGTVPLVALGL